MSDKYIYLDHAATTLMDKEVIAVMNDFFTENYANANSLHKQGQIAKRAIEQSRSTISQLLNCNANELFFTSGATEANNWALQGAYQYWKNRRKKEGSDLGIHFIISDFEHPAITDVAREFLSKEVNVKITYISPESNGLVDAEKIKAAITEETVLISLIYANNEIGTIQPIIEFGKILKEINEERKDRIYFHTDATQAGIYLDMNVENLGVDLLTMSAHKIYGPKGLGALFVKKGIAINNLVFGGHQEHGKRAGTYNVPGIVGFGKAVELILINKEEDILHAEKIKKLLLTLLEENISDYTINGDLEKRLPNNLNVTLHKVEGESILFWLDEANIAISTGSACASGDLGMSPVLAAIGVKQEDSHGSIRVTWGRSTTKDDIKYFIDVLKKTVEKLRGMSPLK